MARLALPELLADLVSVRQTCVFAPFMIPAVISGTVCAYNVDHVPAPKHGLPVEDFVLGYVALGLHNVPILDGDFGTAICIDYSPLPSRWRDRAIALHRAFGGDLNPVRDYFRATGLSALLDGLSDSEEITRYGTPRRALIANAIVPDLRRAAYWPTVRDRALFAEPTATEAEIEEATELALATLAVELRTGKAGAA